VISRRGWYALAAGLGAIGLATYTLSLLLIAGSFAIFVAVAVELVGFHLPAPGPSAAPFEVQRADLPQVVSPGTEAEAEVAVMYRGNRPIRAEARELLPGSLPAFKGVTTERRWWSPGETVHLSYTVRAGARGSHLLGPVAITAESPHGLAWSQWTVAGTEQPIRVVPPAPIERSHRIGPALLTRVQGRLALRHRGYGTEFRSLRPYQPSDDIRHVAWRRSRPDQLYVREFEQESRQDFVLLIDISPPMIAGVPGENALDRAVEAGSLVIAAVARNGEDRVGLMTHLNRPRQYLRPGRGEGHFRRLVENLAYLQPAEGSFDLPSALEALTRRLVTNTHILTFSALDGPFDTLHLAHARFRARGHHLYVFPPNRTGFYPPIQAGHAATRALAWAAEEEHRRLYRRISELRGEGIPVFPYDRRGAAAQVLSTYGQLRAWGMA
jgi:uncharacterized protein (DUF58 family)